MSVQTTDTERRKQIVNEVCNEYNILTITEEIEIPKSITNTKTKLLKKYILKDIQYFQFNFIILLKMF